MDIPWLTLNSLDFPPTASALKEPNGLLAIGGDLSVDRLLAAYRQGIFPWYEEDQPILWWSPNPRCALRLDRLHVSRSLKRVLKSGRFTVTADSCFQQVIEECSGPRNYTSETWISPEMIEAYLALHHAGYAHSIEVWQDEELVGGLYGVALGRVFFGESMFSLADNASKVALVHLVGQLQLWNYELIDCQVDNPHLESLGAELMPRHDFIDFLRRYSADGGHESEWKISWRFS